MDGEWKVEKENEYFYYYYYNHYHYCFCYCSTTGDRKEVEEVEVVETPLPLLIPQLLEQFQTREVWCGSNQVVLIVMNEAIKYLGRWKSTKDFHPITVRSKCYGKVREGNNDTEEKMSRARGTPQLCRFNVQLSGRFHRDRISVLFFAKN